MGSPAGVQLRRWLAFFLCLLVGLNLLAFAASLRVSRTLRAMAEGDEALVPSAVSAQLEVAAAESELFQYFARTSDSTEGAVAHLDSLSKTLERLRARQLSKELSAHVVRVQESASGMRKLIDLLPDASRRSRYRSKLRRQSSEVAALGRDLEGLTMGLTQAAAGELRRRATSATGEARMPVWLSVAAVLASVSTLALLPSWWRRFQELILGA